MRIKQSLAGRPLDFVMRCPLMVRAVVVVVVEGIVVVFDAVVSDAVALDVAKIAGASC